MDDLVFKNIPVEGFDPQSGFSNRVSNPTPSRSGVTPEMSRDDMSAPVFESRLSNTSVRLESADISFSSDLSRLSNPTLSHKVATNEATDSVTPQIDSSASAEPFSRISNPTPTRRASMPETSTALGASETEVLINDDPYSRASNPTPTRRRVNISSNDTPIFGTITGVDMSRASNLTPTRRGNTSIVMPGEFTSSDEVASLSFASVTDPYGAGRTEDSRVSNPTPTRRLFGSDSVPTDDEYDDSSRLSNISPSSRK